MRRVLFLEDFFKDKSAVCLNDSNLFKFLNGVKVDVNLDDGIYKVYNKDIFIGIGIVQCGRIKRDIVI